MTPKRNPGVQKNSPGLQKKCLGVQKIVHDSKQMPISLGGPMGPIHPVWALAAIQPGWGNR